MWQIVTVTKYLFLSFVAHVEIYAFFGGSNGPKICVRGTKFDFEDWGLGHPIAQANPVTIVSNRCAELPKKSQFCIEVPNFTLITRCQGKVPNSKSWIVSTGYWVQKRAGWGCSRLSCSPLIQFITKLSGVMSKYLCDIDAGYSISDRAMKILSALFPSRKVGYRA